MSEAKWERRERKRKAQEKGPRMRGGRSVFEMGKSADKRLRDQRKRAAKARGEL